MVKLKGICQQNPLCESVHYVKAKKMGSTIALALSLSMHYKISKCHKYILCTQPSYEVYKKLISATEI